MSRLAESCDRQRVTFWCVLSCDFDQSATRLRGTRERCPARIALCRLQQRSGRLAHEKARHCLGLARLWRLEGQTHVFGAVGLPRHLRCSAKVEILVAGISDRPPTVAWLERGDGLAFLGHSAFHLDTSYAPGSAAKL